MKQNNQKSSKFADILRKNPIILEIIVLVSCFFVTFVSYLIFKKFYFRDTYYSGASMDGIPAKVFIAILLGGIGIAAVILFVKKKLNFANIVFLIFLTGVVLKIGYMLITPYNYRQHDTLGDVGHEAYACDYLYNFKLPNTNEYQFYHPPLNAFIQGLWMHIMKPFLIMFSYDISDMNVLFETTEILSTMYMVIATYFGIKLIYKLKANSLGKIFGVAFIALFPRLIQFAAQLNNDPLCVMFCFIAVYYSFKWAKDRSYLNAVIIAISSGLAIMAKLLGGLIALVPLSVFIYRVVMAFKNKEEKKYHYIIQGFLVAGIAGILGLWFQVYAMIRFNQPFGFVFSNLTDALYKGDISFFNRFINIFDFKDFYHTLYGNTFENYNLFNFIIRSAIQGEFHFQNAEAFTLISETINYFFVICSFVLMVIFMVYTIKDWINKKTDNLVAIMIALLILISNIGAMIYFNIKMPYGCTMDFRYIVPIVISFAILDGLAISKFKDEKTFKGVFSKVVFGMGTVFLISSSVFYIAAI